MSEDTYLGETPLDLGAFETQTPQVLYEALAREAPFRTDDGMVLLAHMADVTTALKRREVLSGGESMGSDRPLIPLNIDGPDHTKYRRLLDPLFAPKRVANFEPVVRALSDELIDAFIDDGRVELFGAFCDPLPARVFLGILGLPQRDVAFLEEFKEAAIRPRGESPEAALAYQKEKVRGMYAYLNAELDRREALADPGDDLMGWLLEAEVDGDRLTRENILDIVYLLVIVGLDTVASSLSCLIAWFAPASSRTGASRRRSVAVAPGDRGADALRVTRADGIANRGRRHRRERQTGQSRRHAPRRVVGGQPRSRSIRQPARGGPGP